MIIASQYVIHFWVSKDTVATGNGASGKGEERVRFLGRGYQVLGMKNRL